MRYLGLLLFLPMLVSADDDLMRYIDQQSHQYDALALELWDYAELGYLETRSSGRLQETLAREGFEIQQGVAGIPTAFVASYGEGKPVIGILSQLEAPLTISLLSLSVN